MEVPNAHNQAMGSHQQLEGLLVCPKNQQQQEKKPRPHPEQALKCPRCASTNTKFCYYNNYSLSQPRYFCKGCRRYWTQGGSLRNVPVGGGCRKNKRSSSSKKAHDHPADLIATNSFNPLPPTFIPPLSNDDLALAFASLHNQPSTKQLGLDSHSHSFLLGHANTEAVPTVPTNDGFLDILTGSIDTVNPNGLSNLYYGFDANANVELGGGVSGEDGLLSFEGGGLGGAAARTVGSQGSCKDMDEGETKVLMGLPWQVVGGDGNMTAVDSGRDWTGANGSSWHGLINGSLMSGARMDMSSTLGDAYAFF